MGSFDFRGAQADAQRVYFDLAYWFEACAPTDAPFLPDAPCVRAIDVSRPDRHMLPALSSDSPLAWVDAALHAVAVLRGPVVADRLARAVRAAGMAGIEGYGLAWRTTALSDGVARFEIQPVVATLATLGLGAASDTTDDLSLWRLIAKRRADLGLDEADAAGIRLAPPTRPLAAFSLQSAGAASPQALTRLRRVAHRAVERLRSRHGAALARMPLYLGLDGRPELASGEEPAFGAVVDDPLGPGLAAAVREDADWDRMYGHWLRWQAEHPHRRPPHGSSLARWLDAQHAAVRDGRLTRRRTELLDESGLPLAAD